MKNWYTIKVQSNCERYIADRIRQEVRRSFNEEVNVRIPSQGFVSEKGRKIREKLLYPGYIFVESDLIDEIGHVLKNIDGAGKIIKNSEGKPIALRKHEVKSIVEDKEKIVVDRNITFSLGEKVMIKEGAFETFKGSIIRMDKFKVYLSIMIFEKETLVELPITSIHKNVG